MDAIPFVQKMLKTSPVTRKKILSKLHASCPVPGMVSLARMEDMPELLALGNACFRENPPTARQLRYAIDPSKMMLLLHRDKKNRLTSFCLIEFYQKQKRAYLNAFCTDEKYRGKGLGAWWVEAAAIAAKEAGCMALCSHIALKNKASLSLHMKNNFSVMRTERNYYDDGGSAYYLKRDLSREKPHHDRKRKQGNPPPLRRRR